MPTEEARAGTKSERSGRRCVVSLEEAPDHRRRVDLEGGRSGDAGDLLAEQTPGPGVAAAKDDVELDGHAGRAPIGTENHLRTDSGVGGPGTATVLHRPGLNRRRIAWPVQQGRDRGRGDCRAACEGVVEDRGPDAAVEVQDRIPGAMKGDDRN